MFYLHKAILYSNDNEFSRAVCSNMNESHKYNFEKKSNTISKKHMIPLMYCRKTGDVVKSQASVGLGEAVTERAP